MGVERVVPGSVADRGRRHLLAAAVLGRPPAGESVPRAGRRGQGAVGLAVGGGDAGLGAGAAVGVQGDGEGLDGPAGVEGIIAGGVADRGGRHLFAAGILRRPPAFEGVAGPGRRGQGAIGLAIGRGDAGLAAAAAVGVQGHRIGRAGRPTSVQGIVPGSVADRGRRHLLAAAVLRGPPAGESVAGARRRGQRPVSLAIGGGDTGLGAATAVGIQGDGVGLGRPPGIQGIVPRGVAHRSSCHLLAAAVLGGPPALEGIARARRRGQGTIGLAVGHGNAGLGAGPAVGIQGDGVARRRRIAAGKKHRIAIFVRKGHPAIGHDTRCRRFTVQVHGDLVAVQDPGGWGRISTTPVNDRTAVSIQLHGHSGHTIRYFELRLAIIHPNGRQVPLAGDVLRRQGGKRRTEQQHNQDKGNEFLHIGSSFLIRAIPGF